MTRLAAMPRIRRGAVAWVCAHGLTACAGGADSAREDERIVASSGGIGLATTRATGTPGGIGTGEASTAGGAGGSTSAGEAGGSSGASDGSTGPVGAVCGDCVVASGEECDDGNEQDGDGCRNDCTRRWIVFVTSEPSMQADFNGIIGADYECRHRATKMFLPNGERYMAWLSSSEVQPADRMYQTRGPYVVQVAANWDALTSGTLEHPINVTEKSEILEIAVFTGTDITGLRLPNTQHCHRSSRSGRCRCRSSRNSSATDTLWTRGIEAFCGGSGSLYCVEQP